MSKSAVGVEINGTTVRAVALKRGRRGAVIAGYASVEHDGAVSGRDGVVDPDAYRKAFKQALADSRAGRENICIAFWYQDVDVRELEFPVMPEKDLLQSVRFELANVVRFELERDEDLEFDLAPLPGDQTQGRRRLLSMALPRRVTHGLLDPLYRDGIYPEMLEIGAFSLPWVIPREGGICYLHAGATTTQVLIYEGNQFRMTRQINIDLTPLTQLEKGKGDASDELFQGDIRALETFGELVIAVERTLEYYRARRRVGEVSEIVKGVVVSGEAAAAPGFAREFGKRVGIPTMGADPIIGPGDENAFGGEAPLYAVAGGMAVRGLETL